MRKSPRTLDRRPLQMYTTFLCGRCEAGIYPGVTVCPICDQNLVQAAGVTLGMNLRPLAATDLEDIWRWSQDVTINDLTGAWPAVPTRDELRALMAGWLLDPATRAFTIRLGRRAIGNCWLGHVDGTSATLGILIGESWALGRGYGTSAIWLLLAEARDLERVLLWVYADNARAMAVYRKVGFVESGRGVNAGRETIHMLRMS